MDGKSLVFVRGGDLEFPGSADPNPASNPAGVEQDIWVVSPTEKAHKIAQGYSPVIDPRGRRIVFLRARQIWTASLDGTMQPAQLVHARSGASADELTWSPDGSKLAFTSERGNHSFIAVYDFGAKSVTYMDPSVDQDSNAAWSRDSSHVAFVRVFQTSKIRRGEPNRSTSEPWAIRVASAADGAGRQVWRADQGPGSVFHADASEQQLLWAEGGRIVFPWEKDGWEHLYSVSAEGGAATALTPGAFEVEHVSLTDDAKEAVFFKSNQGDIDRRHIWRVALSGGTPRAVTSGQGLEWSPVAVANGAAYLHSDAKTACARGQFAFGSAGT